MPKLYYPTPDELQGDMPLNELLWFERHQYTLLRLVNTNEGRDLLCLDNHPYPIVMLRKNVAKYYLGRWGGRYHFLSDFRIGAKWGNVIRFRWRKVQKALDRMLLEELLALRPLMLPDGRVLRPIAGATTLTAYPDAHVESSTVDGDYQVSPAESAFRAMRDSDGTGYNDNATADACPLLSSNSISNRWDLLRAGCYLFDTSSIGADTKDSAIISFVGEGTTVDNFSQSVCISLSNLASPTAVAPSDFENRSGGVTGSAHTQQSDTRIAFSAWAVGSRNDFTLNSTGLGNVSTSGISSFGTEVLADMDYTLNPSWSSNAYGYTAMYFADQSGTGSDPRLIVEHSTSFIPKVIMF